MTGEGWGSSLVFLKLPGWLACPAVVRTILTPMPMPMGETRDYLDLKPSCLLICRTMGRNPLIKMQRKAQHFVSKSKMIIRRWGT